MSDTPGNGLLDAARLFAKSERRYTTIEVDEIKARMRSLTAKEMRRLRESLYYPSGLPVPNRIGRIAELLVIHCLVDGDGKPVLTEDNLSDFDNQDARLVSALGQAALDHTGWRADYDLSAVDDAKKN